MSYQALYRVWRPQRFDEVIGQQVITQTLKNAIVTHQTSHAYLFAGPRGTGKTSMAKIFAKAVNCRFAKDGEPCNECETCVSITAGTCPDVLEIDAASNNGVEEIRDIRDKVKYAPTEADFKVYIIDEVHMLSTGAFNALLKTLEEPPANVIFILATTEPQKIPATIISRTQRFDFRRIQPQDSYDRMVYILDEKKVDYDERALKVVAKAAEGGMRDALSILDQTLSFGDNEVTLENALLVTGSVTRELLTTYTEQVVAGSTKEALVTLQRMMDEGKDAGRFIEDLVGYARDLLLYKQAPELVQAAELGSLSDHFADFAKQVDSEVLYQMINELDDIQRQMRMTTHPDVYLEILTIKLAEIGRGIPASSSAVTPAAAAASSEVVTNLQREIQELKTALNQLQQSAKPTPTTTEKPKSARKPASTKQQPVNLAKVYPVLGEATRQSLSEVQEVWRDLMTTLEVTQRAVMHVSNPVAASATGIIVAFDYSFLYQKATSDQDLVDALENGLNRVLGKSLAVVFVPKEDWPSIRSDYLTQHKSELTHHEESAADPIAPAESEADNPTVTKAEELFGSDIVNVKPD
ncbi:DNA polymerase III subunit gamma/tau [Levilactobacillus bambusae]|uniref:DNA-directed DNA polymerase n=1 Tax=Levilactobacillus bambusae TaxID=2024736 RepID=A0A2V1MWG3_9LACO|nr:DNA polymerase III subunit gamma/tau [Levilactobacillus bambusae]PWF99388.1 DNA polymerase III subunit gamma/tau [Levilactobacillus bambusae]